MHSFTVTLFSQYLGLATQQPLVGGGYRIGHFFSRMTLVLSGLKSGHFLWLLSPKFFPLSFFFFLKKRPLFILSTVGPWLHSCGLELRPRSLGSNLWGSSPHLWGRPSGQHPGPAWKEGKYSKGSTNSLTRHRLMVRVNFVYKVSFVG